MLDIITQVVVWTTLHLHVHLYLLARKTLWQDNTCGQASMYTYYVSLLDYKIIHVGRQALLCKLRTLTSSKDYGKIIHVAGNVKLGM